jgi:hypothetical protein
VTAPLVSALLGAAVVVIVVKGSSEAVKRKR